MKTSALATMSVAATSAAAAPAYIMYFDQWHTAVLPPKEVTAGVTHVVTAFATSDIFLSGSAYEPFMPLDQVRALFDEGVQVCMAIGGWGDTAGFGQGAATEESRKAYAANVAEAVERLGYDCVDVDWEYPGGNGEDYKQIPNDQKVQEIEQFPLFLQAIKDAIGDKEISIAVPGKEGDMIAFTAETVPVINEIVDHVNVMTYDLMNRRNTETRHHTGIEDSKESIELYIERGMSPEKMILGIAFYAKWFTTQPGAVCDAPVGCPAAVMEAPDGSDTGLSGAITFEAGNVAGDLANALENGKTDEEGGGQWYWDSAKEVFWSWETPELIARKFEEIVKAYKLGGTMAWSLAQDSHDWSRFKAMQEGMAGLSS